MQNVRRLTPGASQSAEGAFRARLRLFALLALLAPMFAGLQYLVREAVPRVEIRLVSQDVQAPVPVMVPVEVPVERVVERIVYVPVERSETVPPLEAPAASEPARDNTEPVAAADTERIATEAEPEAVGEAAAESVQAPAAAPAAPAVIASGTYRPQPVVARPAPAAPVSEPDQANDAADEQNERIDVAETSPAEEAEVAASEPVEVTELVAMTVVQISTDGSAPVVSVEMVPVTRIRQPDEQDAAETPAGEGVNVAAGPEDDAAPLAEAEGDPEAAAVAEASTPTDDAASVALSGEGDEEAVGPDADAVAAIETQDDEAAPVADAADEPDETAVFEPVTSELAVTQDGLIVEVRQGQ